MAGVSIGRDVAASSERVWSVITDLDRSPEVIRGITAVERLDGGPGFGLGTRWRETRRMFGREAAEVMEVTEVEEGRSYTVEADSRGAHYVCTVIVAPKGDGSHLSMTFESMAQGTVARLLSATMGRLVVGNTRKALQQDLDDIAAAAELAAS